MSMLPLPVQSRLHGVRIFLSGSTPTPERDHEFQRIPDAAIRIEEAVASVARAVFVEGGTLVFGAHPSISPLVARVIDHYYIPAPAEDIQERARREEHLIKWQNPSLVIYQSRAYFEHWAEATERLARHPLVSVKWTEAVEEEVTSSEAGDWPQTSKSLQLMREQMIEEARPEAMIAIGGMEGIIEEAKIFVRLRPRKPIFTLLTTGGAAAVLCKHEEFVNRVRVPDSDAEHLVRKFWSGREDNIIREHPGEEERTKYYIPYAFVAQQIVAEIIATIHGSTHGRTMEA